MLKIKNWNLTILLLLIVFFIFVFVDVNFQYKFDNNDKALCKNCNIVVLDIDVLRSDAIDCKENYDRTPNICDFESNANVFTQNINQSDMTLPSLISFETSLYPSSHGVWHELYPIDNDSYKYIGELLQEKGYTTAFMGFYKYHNKVTVRGFQNAKEISTVFSDDFKPIQLVDELKNSGKPYFLYLYIADMHFPYLPYGLGILDNPYKAPEGLPRTNLEYRDAFADYLVKNYKSIFRSDALKDYPELFNEVENNKYLIWWNYTLWAADKEKTAKYLSDAWKAQTDPFMSHIDVNNPGHVLYLKYNYLSILNLIDNRISDFLKYLKNPDNSKNTIVLLRTDHGEEFMEHGRLEHGNNLYQELINTPLVIKVPGVKPSVVDNMTQDIDVLPTLWNILGWEKLTQFQGKSLLPLITQKEEKINKFQIAQKGEGIYIASYKKGNWKVIIKKGAPTELYDLSFDPLEQQNIISSNLNLARQMFEEYKSIVDLLPKYGLKQSPLPTWIDEGKRERLKNEGYF